MPTKRSAKEKEQRLLDKIEKAKKELIQLQAKRQLEIGKLARHHGLDALDDNQLNEGFAKLANELLIPSSPDENVSHEHG